MSAPQPVGNDFRVDKTLFARAQAKRQRDRSHDGGFVVAWESQNGDSLTGFGVRAQVYNALGAAPTRLAQYRYAKTDLSIRRGDDGSGGFPSSWVARPGSAGDG